MNRVKQINRVFLVTVGTAVFGSVLVSLFEFKNYFISILLSQVLLILPMLVYVLVSKRNILEVIRFRKIKLVNAGLAIIFAILISPLMTLLNAISLLFSTNVIDKTVQNVVENNPLILSVFVIAFIPCVLEESVYRGCFFNEYRKVNPKKAIILSGLLFGLMHMNFNQFIYAFAMGTIFALMVEATDSILTTMIIHFTINANSVLLTYMMPKIETVAHMIYGDKAATEMFSQNVEYTVSTLIPVILYYAVVAAFTTTLAFLLFRLIAKIEGRWDHVKAIFEKKSAVSYPTSEDGLVLESITDKQEKLISFSLIAGIVICIVIMIWVELGL